MVTVGESFLQNQSFVGDSRLPFFSLLLLQEHDWALCADDVYGFANFWREMSHEGCTQGREYSQNDGILSIDSRFQPFPQKLLIIFPHLKILLKKPLIWHQHISVACFAYNNARSRATFPKIFKFGKIIQSFWEKSLKSDQDV